MNKQVVLDPLITDERLTFEQVNAIYGLYTADMVNSITHVASEYETDRISITGYLYPNRLQKELNSPKSSFIDGKSPNMPNTHTLSIGIDEAGRGPLLGGVMVSAVLLPTILSGTFVQLSDDINFKSSPLAGLNDSKKLTAKRREQYAQAIQDTAIGYVLVDVPAVVIDGINVLQASLLAMQLASDTMLKQISAGVYDVYGYDDDGDGVGDKSIIKRLQIKPLVDGNRLPSLMMADHHHLWQPLIQTYDWSVSQLCPQAIIKGDMLHSSIAAASILAKVSRDKQMLVLAKRYPQYLIDKHKGYPTQAHLLAIAEHGILPEHRRSFAPICSYRKSH